MTKVVKTFKKIGNWDIGIMEYNDNPKDVHLFVRGNEYGENPIAYSHKQAIGYDRPERIPDSVKTWLFNNHPKVVVELAKIKNPSYFNVWAKESGLSGKNLDSFVYWKIRETK